MMKILSIAFGNIHEAFIYDGFTSNLNIITSDDNNKGKTIAIQSMMYCLGSFPAFPISYNYKDYYCVLEFELEEKRVSICRKNDSFLVKQEFGITILDNQSEFRHYWNKHFFRLPSILKDGEMHLVYFELFLQMFFVGQDKKDTSNIANKGFYNKEDFTNMLFDYLNFGSCGESSIDHSLASRRLNELQQEKKVTLKQYKILKDHSHSISYISAVSDQLSLEQKIKEISEISESINGLKRERNRSISSKAKHESALKELRSLNRTINTGELRCLDCNSNHIGYKTEKKEAISFDVSTPEIRSSIISSIQEKIQIYADEIDRTTKKINIYQEQLTKLLNEEGLSLEALIFLAPYMTDISQAEQKLAELDAETNSIRNSLEASKKLSTKHVQQQRQLLYAIVDVMNKAYRFVDPSGNLEMNALFTHADQIYSGSEATLYHLIRLYALAVVTEHNFPIVVDSFRAEDLSTVRENKIIELFSKLKNQIVFTTTLKAEEMSKYDNDPRVHKIDFSVNESSKILQESYLPRFTEILKSFSILN